MKPIFFLVKILSGLVIKLFQVLAPPPTLASPVYITKALYHNTFYEIEIKCNCTGSQSLSWFWNPNRTIRSDRKNLEPLIFAVLLTLRTVLCEKCMKPLEPRSNRTVLRTMTGFRGSHGSIFLQYLAGKLISIHKEFEYKKYKNKLQERKRKQRAGLTAQAKL